ncbi:hypothetical protein [Pseudomonas aeruginosa]|uniref:hypothetical protein n=1 Tax=Pseudomonas aeruginosa TaxID=287 RepID=UPI001AAF1317|nr:hypothetical protein [Pseudomonas aeruginosa]MBO2834817.1 hypothetical protein [Pseudomonas aeruginosa]MCO1673764.1 hypothetical protein [Pseudomonas aeruginosa]MCO1771541.1 hypothetical protein [Pseudomonas aeruginosa]
MPTLGWIQEVGLNRFWETGSELGTSALPSRYACRYCDQFFESIAAREQHELEHPLLNPTMFYRDRELGGTDLLISTPIQLGDIGARNISKIELNGQPLSSVTELTQALQSVSQGFFRITYANEVLEKSLKIEVCIADPEHLNEVDQAFRMHFSSGSVADPLLEAFTASVRHCSSVRRYIDGLVRYLHGLKAKDHQSDITTFESFDKRFNQALASLSDYTTPLAAALRAVIRFNRNDFGLMHCASGLPDLDRAVAFFNGADLGCSTFASPDAQLPVDQASEFILGHLMPVFSDSKLADIEEMLTWLPTKYRSLQDTSKLNYLCFRKAVAVEDMAAVEKYRKKLRHDEAFNTLIGET